MLKKLFFIIFSSLMLNANINVKVQNILGYSDYNTHKNLINYIFQNKSSFYTNGRIDYVSLTQNLQNNGLLKLNLGSTRYIDITFILNDSQKKSLNTLKGVLKSLGHYYYFTTEATKSGSSLKWKIKLKTAAAINPLQLSKELQLRNCRVIDIKREGINNWTYSIDSSNSDVYKAEDLVNNRELSLRKPLKPYMLKISSASKITINSNSGNRWFPNVVFYDKDLNIIEIFKDDSLQSNLKLDVPNDTNYIKIEDLYTLANLKRGINITKE